MPVLLLSRPACRLSARLLAAVVLLGVAGCMGRVQLDDVKALLHPAAAEPATALAGPQPRPQDVGAASPGGAR